MSKMIAVCSSFRCSGAEEKSLNQKNFAAKPHAKTNTCPDCGHALRWVKENDRRNKYKPKHRSYKDENRFSLNQS